MNTTSAAFSSLIAWTVTCSGLPDPIPMTEMVLMLSPRQLSPRQGGGRGRGPPSTGGCRRSRGAARTRPTMMMARPADSRAADLLGEPSQAAAQHDLLVRPARPRHHRRRAVGTVVRQQLRGDPVDVLDGQVQHERGAGGCERGQVLARGHRRGAGRARVSMTVCPTPGKVSSCRSAAAAAANAGTPGTICHGTPAASSRLACSATALKIEGHRCAAGPRRPRPGGRETSSAVIASRSSACGVDQPGVRAGARPAPRAAPGCPRTGRPARRR